MQVEREEYSGLLHKLKAEVQQLKVLHSNRTEVEVFFQQNVLKVSKVKVLIMQDHSHLTGL